MKEGTRRRKPDEEARRNNELMKKSGDFITDAIWLYELKTWRTVPRRM